MGKIHRGQKVPKEGNKISFYNCQSWAIIPCYEKFWCIGFRGLFFCLEMVSLQWILRNGNLQKYLNSSAPGTKPVDKIWVTIFRMIEVMGGANAKFVISSGFSKSWFHIIWQTAMLPNTPNPLKLFKWNCGVSYKVGPYDRCKWSELVPIMALFLHG